MADRPERRNGAAGVCLARHFAEALTEALKKPTREQQTGAAIAATVDLIAAINDDAIRPALDLFGKDVALAVLKATVFDQLLRTLPAMDDAARLYAESRSYDDDPPVDAIGRALAAVLNMVKTFSRDEYLYRGAPLEHLRTALGNVAIGKGDPLFKPYRGRGRTGLSIQDQDLQLIAAVGVEYMRKHLPGCDGGKIAEAVEQTLRNVGFKLPNVRRSAERKTKEEKGRTVRGWHTKVTAHGVPKIVTARIAEIETLAPSPRSLKEAEAVFGGICRWLIDNVRDFPRKRAT